MAEHPVWIPHGARMSVDFATIDLKIRELTGFVSDVAADLARGNSLAAAARSAVQRYPAAAQAFDLGDRDALVEARFALKDSITFVNEPLPATINFERRGARLSLGLDCILAREVKSLLALCGAGRWTAKEIHHAVDEPASIFLDSLIENGIVVAGVPAPSPCAPLPSGPGVTRLQHAGLLFRGRNAGILVDPHLHSSYEPDGLSDNFLRFQFEDRVDAILISHGHHDHWHLSTLMTFPSDTMIVVPRVPRATMLCPDFSATLRALGFTRVVTLGWSDPPIHIGDLEVHALPFYGEQPLASETPRHPDLRNYGNTYLVRHDSYTSWFLVDSGNDCMGQMTQVAHDVKQRFGTIDILMSNLREFALYQPLAITGGHYWLALTPDQLRRFESISQDLITLGPNGVAEVCHIVQARRFLPYAHWWGEIGAPAPDEQMWVEQLSSSLGELGATTKILPWSIGDSWRPA